MTKSEMAVAIAKDVIEQLRGPLKAASHYCYLTTTYSPTNPDCDLRDILPEMLKEGCTVCALGAALISKAKLFDAVPLRSLILNHLQGAQCVYEMHVTRILAIKMLESVFSDNTLNDIESAFEKFPNVQGRNTYGAACFGCKYADDTERLVAIMENVIANNGEFVVPEVSVEEYKKCFDAPHFSIDLVDE